MGDLGLASTPAERASRRDGCVGAPLTHQAGPVLSGTRPFSQRHDAHGRGETSRVEAGAPAGGWPLGIHTDTRPSLGADLGVEIGTETAVVDGPKLFVAP